ncbi:hypothetical protein BKA93DRAFT_558080 [Sparassis latifolia]
MYASTVHRLFPLDRGQYPVARHRRYIAAAWAAARLGRSIFPSKEHYTVAVLSDFDGSGRHHPRHRGLGTVPVARHTAMGEVGTLVSGFRDELVSLGKRRHVPDIFPDLDADVNPTFKRFTEEDRARHASQMGVFSVDNLVSGIKRERAPLSVKERRAKRDEHRHNKFIPTLIKHLTRTKNGSLSPSLRDAHTVTFGRPRATYLHDYLKPYDSNHSYLCSRMETSTKATEKPSQSVVDYPPLTIEEVITQITTEENEMYYDAEEDFYGLTPEEEAFVDMVCDELDARRRATAMDVNAVSTTSSAPTPMMLKDIQTFDDGSKVVAVVIEDFDQTLVNDNDKFEKQLETALAEPYDMEHTFVHDPELWAGIELGTLDGSSIVPAPNTNLDQDVDMALRAHSSESLTHTTTIIDEDIFYRPTSIADEDASMHASHIPSQAHTEFYAVHEYQSLTFHDVDKDEAFFTAPLPSLNVFAALDADPIMIDEDAVSDILSSPSPMGAPYDDNVLPAVGDGESCLEAADPAPPITATEEEVEAFLATVLFPPQPAAQCSAELVDFDDVAEMDNLGQPYTDVSPEREGDVPEIHGSSTAVGIVSIDEDVTYIGPIEACTKFTVEDGPAATQASDRALEDAYWDDLFGPDPEALRAYEIRPDPLVNLPEEGQSVAVDAFDALVADMRSFSLSSTPIHVPDIAPAPPSAVIPSFLGEEESEDEVLCGRSSRKQESSGLARTQRSSRRMNPLGNARNEFNEWRDGSMDRGDTSYGRSSVKRLLKRNKEKDKENKKTGFKIKWNPKGQTAEEILKVVAPTPPKEDDCADAMGSTGISSSAEMDGLISAFGSITAPSLT